jgi:hypothetical protein
MKAPQQLLYCALAVMLSSTGWARIGETLDECIQRYGEVTFGPRADGFGNQMVQFTKLPYTVTVVLKNGTAVAIGYFRYSSDLRFGRLPDSYPMDADEVQTLVERNPLDGVPWNVSRSGASGISFTHPNGAEAMATAAKQGGFRWLFIGNGVVNVTVNQWFDFIELAAKYENVADQYRRKKFKRDQLDGF